MLVCSECGAAAPGEQACPNCGAAGRAHLDHEGTVVQFVGDTGMACAACGDAAAVLDFRRYRRVVGLLLLDRIHDTAGYFCADCCRRMFWRHIGLTLLLGWWGVLALLFRNPWAIGVNLKALRSPPRRPERYGAISLDALHEAQDLSDAIAAGEANDAWVCRACDAVFPTWERALKHADSDHIEMRFDDAKAALVPLDDGTSH